MNYYLYGKTDARFVLVRPAGGHDEASEAGEYGLIRGLSGSDDFVMAAVPVASWNHDLSPWCAPPVFGKESFGDGAKGTLSGIEKELLPALEEALAPRDGRKYCIGGYSLAGLFSLWAAFESTAFAGCAACSPSVWFPGFTDYVKNHEIRTPAVDLSLGDREEKAKNRAFAAVGDCIRECDRIFEERGLKHVLEWNPGNHFRDGDLRTAKGFAWIMRKLQDQV